MNVAIVALIIGLRGPADPSERLELKALAGVYVESNGFTGSTWTIEADGKLIYQEYTDTGKPPPQEGTIALVDGRLIPRLNGPSAFFVYGTYMNPKLFPIRWGGRVYLLPDNEDEFLMFCNLVNLGIEPRNEVRGRFLARAGAAGERELKWAQAEGSPGLPERWLPWLLKEPRRGKVLEVDPSKTQAKIDLGSDDGVRVGMLFHAENVGEDELDTRRSVVEIIAVEPRSCTARAKLRPKFGGFRIGQVISTKLPEIVLKKGMLERVWSW